METNVNYTIVGVFVIALSLVIIFGIIWLSAGITRVEYKTYQVNMQESVSGLNVDAPVEYNGVNVGSVTDVELNRHQPQTVKLLLRIKADTPITVGTKAKLDIRSLSGVAYLGLQDNGKNMTPLSVLPGEKYPIIQTTPSIFLRLDTALTQLSTSFSEFSHSFHQLLDKDNLVSIKRILQSSGNSIHLFETETIPATNEAIVNVNNMTRNLSQLLVEIKQNPAVLIRGKEQPKLGPGEN